MAKTVPRTVTASPKATRTEAKEPRQKRAYPERVHPVKPVKFERVSPERFKAAERALVVILGKNLREARQRAGLTQANVAEITHSDQPHIGAIERGERNIRVSLLARLAYAVKTDPDALLLGDHAPQYSVRTLVRLIGALHAHLQATIGDDALKQLTSELMTVLTASDGSPAPAEAEQRPARVARTPVKRNKSIT
jgi:transcriptional regulator with XRE-family HTH domain